jgi:hypothetical protein
MNIKSFTLSAIAGTIVYFLLGWLFYGTLFTEIYPTSGNEKSLSFIFVGCLFYSLIFSLIFSKWAHISTFKSGTIAGIYLGILYSISMNFFMYSSSDLNVEHFITDVLITTVSTAIMCGAIGYIIGKTKE